VAAPPIPAPFVPATIPPERFPQRLAELCYTGAILGGVEVIAPPMCDVPAGEFLMGSDPLQDKAAESNEQPRHSVGLPAYQIARFPVTVAEYACLVRAGHEEPPRLAISDTAVDWQTQLKRLDHPVVCVSWRDAVTYATWLAGVTGQVWRLPTEAEWEKAARWETAYRHARVYPWGSSFDRSRCNTNTSGIGHTTPVSTYPSGASPCGAQDMAGNVWEWTSTLRKPYPYTAGDGREDLDSSGARAMRGGSWFHLEDYTRAAYRYSSDPGASDPTIGFRVVRAVPGSTPR
jgi:formylglycine-generating enzyme required for sulfatase activity